METEKMKPPKYRDGTLICPHCNLPLLVDEETYFKIRCHFCGGLIGKVPFKILKEMFADASESMLKEWLAEMKAMKRIRLVIG